MNTHKKLRKVYGENVCTACGKSWEDGDEVPICDDEHPRVERVAITLPPLIPTARTRVPDPEFSCWLMLSASGFAMVGYARHYGEALELAHRWAGSRVVEVRQWVERKAPVDISKPYLELSPKVVKELDIAHGQSFIKIVSPVHFKRVA